MYKLIKVIALTVVLLLAFPTAVYAQDSCNGIACWFSWNMGFTERAQISADARVEIAKEETQRSNDEIKLQNDYNARIQEINRQADAMIMQTQTNEKIAQWQKDQHIADVTAWKEISNNAINADMQKELAVLRGTVSLGLESLEQVGETKRWAITADMIGWLAAFILIAIGFYLWTRRPQAPYYNVNVFPDQRRRLPGQQQSLPGHMQYPATIDQDDFDDYETDWQVQENHRIGQTDVNWQFNDNRQPQRQMERKGGNNAITPRNGGQHW